MKRLLFLASLLVLMACEKEVSVEVVRPVKTISVQLSNASSKELSFPGVLRAFKRADLSFRVDGIVVKRDVVVGQLAKKSEILLQLDTREYEIALRRAQGNVDNIKAQLSFAEKDYIRMKNIFKKDPGAISESMLDRKNENANQLKAQLVVAESDLDQAVDNLSYTSLKAPFDGIVAAIYVENHEQIKAQQNVLRFLDTAEREMEINVPEKYINAILEQKAQLQFEVVLDSFSGRTFRGVIKEIGTEASSTTQTYPVTLSIQDIPLELSLLAGMSGRAIVINSKTAAMHVFELPKSAIFTDNAHDTYVWVVDPQTQIVHRTPVSLDINYKGKGALVRDGLKAGDRVVIAGTSFLNEGQKVQLDVESLIP